MSLSYTQINQKLESAGVTLRVAALLEVVSSGVYTFQEISDLMGEKVDKHGHGPCVRVIQRYPEFFVTQQIGINEYQAKGLSFRHRRPRIIQLTALGQKMLAKIK
ncbi:hypothetical protein [Photobacterium halotolerans]|uniref:hypothetical protein n=1 Tax=Photobacterium halotolerans TaxID=265726 RepID=UPI000481B562|nr:hypothetical protein [Photobacterium halotolerans]